MVLLKKLFSLREKSIAGDDEKPFLEHLDDLRVTITKIVLTILIATIVAWAYREPLMEVIRRPIDQVWETQQAATLPTSLTPDQWECAKIDAEAAAGLTDAHRRVFLATIDEEPAFHAESLLIYRSLLRVEADDRDDFLDQLEPLSEEMRAQLASLIEKNPKASLDAASKIKLMGAFKPTETFMLSMKLAFFAAIVVTFPLLLYFVLQFVLPGLKENERKALWPALAIGFGLFLIGVSFSYFMVLPLTLEFFFTFGEGMQIENDWRIGYYINFATRFTLIFGLAFELPVVVMTLVKIGLLESQMMRNTRSYAILAIFLIAAVITPTPDIFTLCLLGVPMCLLYEMCIWLSVWLERKERRKEAEEEKERLENMLATSSAANAATETPDDNSSDDEDVAEVDTEEEERIQQLLSPPSGAVGSDDPYANADDDEMSDEYDDGVIDEDLLKGLDDDDTDSEGDRN